MDFQNYDKCYNACFKLAWSHSQLSIFASIIGDTHFNWENVEVQKALDNIMTITTEAINKNIIEQNAEFLDFVKESYRFLLNVKK